MQANLSLRARYCSPPNFRIEGKPTAAQRMGLRYQEQVFGFLKRWASGHNYTCKIQPWIAFTNVAGQTKYCQPDAILLSNTDDNLIIPEIKLRHTRAVVQQLRKYRDMMLALHPDCVVSLVEICRYFDMSEMPIEVMTELRPHNLPLAAIIWEPEPCLGLN